MLVLDGRNRKCAPEPQFASKIFTSIMGYTVETALSLRGQVSRESDAVARRELAQRHQCDSQYFTHAAEGRGKNSHRLAVVHTVSFACASLSPVIEYIRDARRECRVRVECVYEEGSKCRMLYASGRYIKQLPRMEGRALRAELETSGPGRTAQERDLVAVCTGRRENMSCVYTHARDCHQPSGQGREAQENQRGAMRLPVQIQAEGASGLHGNGKG